LAQARRTLLLVIRSVPNTTIVTDDPTYIRVEVFVPGFGFVDDVEFSLDDEARVIHFRSSSRVPYYDWSVNRNRMEQIREAFKTAVEQD
jgi:uncharacterized protein (DUF1499 family)